ncbi:MAG: hypothetical protein HQ530_05620 [Parcubacteria group bacterium]|nr:hypothetical protein [Parcubacteria group bacterium]
MRSNQIKHIWSVVCEDAIVDSKSNKISLINNIEEINVNVRNDKRAKDSLNKLRKDKKKAVIPVKFVLASLWSYNVSKDGSLDTKIEFIGPNKKLLWAKECKTPLPKTRNRTRTIFKFDGLFIPNKSGVCYLVLKLKSNTSFSKQTEIPIEIKIQE